MNIFEALARDHELTFTGIWFFGAASIIFLIFMLGQLALPITSHRLMITVHVPRFRDFYQACENFVWFIYKLKILFCESNFDRLIQLTLTSQTIRLRRHFCFVIWYKKTCSKTGLKVFVCHHCDKRALRFPSRLFVILGSSLHKFVIICSLALFDSQFYITSLSRFPVRKIGAFAYIHQTQFVARSFRPARWINS